MIPKWLPILFLFAALAWSGCATRTITVDVPVPVPCRVPEVTRPSFAVDTLKSDEDVFVVSRALWATIEQWEGYELEMQAAINACK